MSAADLTVVLLGVLAVLLAAITAALCAYLVAVIRELRATLEIVRNDVVPAVEDLRAAALDAQGDVERLERMLEGSELVADRVDAASKLAYSAFSRPVIKAMAVRAGTAEAVRRIRGQ